MWEQDQCMDDSRVVVFGEMRATPLADGSYRVRWTTGALVGGLTPRDGGYDAVHKDFGDSGWASSITEGMHLIWLAD